MQFKVPQNIMMEDKIIGPLTAIQFAIVIVGGGVAFSIFNTQSIPAPFNQVIAITLALITLIVAVGKFNDQPIYRFLRFFLVYLITPKTRVWHKGGQGVKLIKPTSIKSDASPERPAKIVNRKDLSKLAELIDSKGTSGFAPRIHPVQDTEASKQNNKSYRGANSK